MRSTDISPAPSDEEAAAIVVAVETLWPKPVTVLVHDRQGPPTWRFSGRWWQRDRLSPRERPWS